MRTKLTVCSFAIAILAVGCGGNSDSDFTTDQNGRNDMLTNDMLVLHSAIGQECAGAVETSPDTEGECKAMCDCATVAVAKLEGVADLPDATAACYAACSPSFVETNNDPISEDDEDHAPDYADYYMDYIQACDEVAHQVVHGGDTVTDECIATCTCIADHMENTMSETEDDNFRNLCSDQCTTSVQKTSTKNSGAAMLHFLSGGL